MPPLKIKKKILALEAEVQCLEKNKKNNNKGKEKGKDTKGEDKKRKADPNWAWKKVAPKDGQSKTKKHNDKIYHWCPHHELWCLHKPDECKKKQNKDKDKKTNPTKPILLLPITMSHLLTLIKTLPMLLRLEHSSEGLARDMRTISAGHSSTYYTMLSTTSPWS